MVSKLVLQLLHVPVVIKPVRVLGESSRLGNSLHCVVLVDLMIPVCALSD